MAVDPITIDWTRYTVTAVLGVIAGLVVTFGHITFDNAKQIAVTEERYETIMRRLDKIEAKLPLAKQ